MYSHDLQTCDWPRNVGCDVQAEQQAVTARDGGSHDSDAFHVVANKFRFSSSPAQQAKPEQLAERHQTQFQPQHTIPPPPELRIAPNPVITSRGQPQPFEPNDIAKVNKYRMQCDCESTTKLIDFLVMQLYAEAHETLPPAEEEESDRQQRVYRGQPSTIGQVQRDRDGLITQHVNALPSHGKVGSFSFGSQLNQHK